MSIPDPFDVRCAVCEAVVSHRLDASDRDPTLPLSVRLRRLIPCGWVGETLDVRQAVFFCPAHHDALTAQHQAFIEWETAMKQQRIIWIREQEAELNRLTHAWAQAHPSPNPAWTVVDLPDTTRGIRR